MRWRVGLRARASGKAGRDARAVTSGALRSAPPVRATWLDGPGVTVVTDARRSKRTRPRPEKIQSRVRAVRALWEEFWENHPLEFAGDEPRATTEDASETPPTEDASETPPKRDAFVLWMLKVKELAPAVFAREIEFKREFSKDGRPFTTAMRLVDEWTASNMRRFLEQCPSHAGDVSRERSGKIGEEEDEDASCGTEILPTFQDENESERDTAEKTSIPTFELEPFPVLPLELLPVQHFVMGLWSTIQPKAGDAATPRDGSQTPPAPNSTKETFSLPWLDPTWVDLLSPASPSRKKRARVWKGKNLDMIVYGSDERNSWSKKIGDFLKRARSALGNRVLHRQAWGGSILDSVIGANLTQNVSDVLSSTAFMNLAARFPCNASTETEHETRVYIHTIVLEIFDRIRSAEARLMRTPIGLDDAKTNDDETNSSDTATHQPFDTPPRVKRVVKKPEKLSAAKPKSKSKEVSSTVKEALARPDPPRSKLTMDQVDWYAVLDAPLVDIVKCIRCRGMHWMLARRIKMILKRVMAQRGCLSLEFLREAPTDEAREYLLALDGMGVKTTSCVLLLALHRTDFPVDVNVGRIMARLGWVPLESETALEELAQYAPEPAVYTFLRKRLNSFGIDMLYELHYHMITLGKVFCGKRLPNCGACPLRDICEYAKQGGRCIDRPDGHTGLASLQPQKPVAPMRAASEDIEDIVNDHRPPHTVPSTISNSATSSVHVLRAVISAGMLWDRHGRPPGRLATNVLLLSASTAREEIQMAYIRLSRAVHPDKNPHPDAARAFNYITEARRVELNLTSGEDALAKNIEAELDDMIRMAAQDYEATVDEITGMELSETVVKASKVRSETVGWMVPTNLLPVDLIEALSGEEGAKGCIAVPIDANATSIDEITKEKIAVAILTPCASSMGNKFPLHGTYFQTNEVFLDEKSSVVPLKILKDVLVKCRRVRVLVGTSIGSITRGMSRAQVTAAFASQRICVRSWNRVTKQPGPLPRWLCPFFPQPLERPLEPEPAPLSKNGRPLGSALVLLPQSQVLSPVITQSQQLAKLAATAPEDSVEHKLLKEFQQLFKGQGKPKMSPALKRVYAGVPNDPNRKRRKLFPSIRRAEKCGYCKNCLNPSFKQACVTRRNEMRTAPTIA